MRRRIQGGLDGLSPGIGERESQRMINTAAGVLAQSRAAD
jgi:hypothetical protein